MYNECERRCPPTFLDFIIKVFSNQSHSSLYLITLLYVNQYTTNPFYTDTEVGKDLDMQRNVKHLLNYANQDYTELSKEGEKDGLIQDH